MLADIGQNEIGRNRCHLVQVGFAELPFNIVFAGEAETAVRLQAGVGRLPGGFGRKIFGHVGRRAAWQPRIELGASPITHQVGGFDLDPRFRQELNALILADGPTEDYPIPGEAVARSRNQ